MGSSAKTGKKNFQGSPEHFLDKNAIWDRTPPPTHQLQSTCVGVGSRVPNLQTEFNYLDSFKSYGIFSDFVVPMLPHVVPVVPTSSLCHPHCPPIIPIAPKRSPCCLHDLWSPWSPPHVVPHIIPVVPTSSPCHPHHPHIVPIAPRRSQCGLHDLWSPLSPWSPPHVVPVVPTSSPCHHHHPHII